MRIGFDAKRAFNNHTGLGNYSRFVLDALLTNHSEHQYFLYTPKQLEEYKNIANTDHALIRLPQGSFYQKFHSLWRTFGLITNLKSDHIDVYHGLSNELPSRISSSGIKSVVTIHDLIFKRFPHFYKKSDRIIYEKKSKVACNNADKIIAISMQTKRDIVGFYDIDDSKVEVIYQDCHPRFHVKADTTTKQEVRQKHHLNFPYILSVGTFESRKNQLTLLRAFHQMEGNKDVHLVLTGRPTDYAEQLYAFVKDNQLENRVHFLTDVQHQELPALYQMAELFAYPSIFEGFGIPILEALHSETPVLTSRGSCFAEAGGAAALYTDADDPAEMANGMYELLSNSETRQRLDQKRSEQLQKFSSKLIGQQLIDLYNTL